MLLGSPVGHESYAVTECHSSQGLYVKDGKPLHPDRVLSTAVGPDGAFRFPPQAEPGIVLVLDDRGFALRPEAELAESPLTIAPWGRVEGVARANGAPAPFAEVNLDIRVHFDARDTSDAQGRFAIDRVPPGDAAVARGIAIGSNTVGFGPWQPIHVEPGETLELTVGGEGRPVVGRLALPEGLALDPRRPAVRLDLEPPPGPAIPEGLSPDERRDWFRRWAETEAGRAYVAWQADRRSCPVVIDADSTFRADDVRPGTYILELRLIDAGTGEPAPIGEKLRGMRT